MVIEIQHWSYMKGFVLWTCPKHQLWRLRRKIPPLSMKISLSRPLMFHAHFLSLQGSLCVVPLSSMRKTTTHHSSFANFLGGWL
jgi:hypothetical protein